MSWTARETGQQQPDKRKKERTARKINNNLNTSITTSRTATASIVPTANSNKRRKS